MNMSREVNYSIIMLRDPLLGGSWGLVSKVTSTPIGVISNYMSIVTLIITLVTKSHDPLSSVI